MSRANVPNLPWVLPLYEEMRKFLQQNIDDTALPSQLRIAADAGMKKLSHYNDLANKNHFNIIATSWVLYLYWQSCSHLSPSLPPFIAVVMVQDPWFGGL
jgi:hypothetical protein